MLISHGVGLLSVHCPGLAHDVEETLGAETDHMRSGVFGLP